MQSPEREFSFVVSTPMGGVMVKFQDVEWSEPGKPLFYPKSEYAFDTFADWLEGSARNMRGYGFDLESSFSPRSLHEALTCAKTVGNSDVTDFVFLGVPPEDDGEEDDEGEDGAVLESAQVRTPLTVEENIQRGREAMSRVIERHVNEPRAMYRKGLGWIAFFWGKAGGEPPKCKGGHGVSKILAKREWEGRCIEELIGQTGASVAYKLVEVIARGDFGTVPGRRIRVQKKDFIVYLSKEFFGKEVVWLLTGFREVETQTIINSPDVPAVGPETGGPTHPWSTRSAPMDGSGAVSVHLPGSGTGGEVTSEIAMKNGFGKDILESSPSWRDQIMAATTWESLSGAFMVAMGLTPKPLAEMTKAEYRRMVYDAAIAAMKAGNPVVIATQTKARQVIPQTLGFNDKKGTILHYEGKTAGWVVVEFQALDSLAHGLGLPTTWDHTKAVSDAKPEEEYDPTEDEKPSLTMRQMDFSIGVYLDVPETQAIKALTAENVADVIQNALEEQYRELLASYIRGERPDLMDVIDGKDAVPPVAEVETQEPATVVAKKSYLSIILAGLDTNEMTNKLVSVKGTVKGTNEKGEGMMYAKDALEGIAADVEDYSRLLECL